MKPRKMASPERQEQLRAELYRDIAAREQGYRSKAISLLPHICARCAREFSGKRLKELTVHHKDHNHNNNPPDGSNWELLCIYCHDNEHEKALDGRTASSGEQQKELPPSIFSQFEGLDRIIAEKSDQQIIDN